MSVFPLTTADRIAEFASAGARRCYANDGDVIPQLILVGEGGHGLMLTPHPRWGGHPPDAFAEIVFRLGKVHAWRYIATVSETWMRYAEPGDPDLERGDLAKAAEAGDERVKTAIVVLVMDLHHPDQSLLHMRIANGQPPTVTWLEEEDHVGEQVGYMPKSLMRAWTEAPRPPVSLPEPPMSVLSEIVTTAGLATVALTLTPEGAWS